MCLYVQSHEHKRVCSAGKKIHPERQKTIMRTKEDIFNDWPFITDPTPRNASAGTTARQ